LLGQQDCTLSLSPPFYAAIKPWPVLLSKLFVLGTLLRFHFFIMGLRNSSAFFSDFRFLALSDFSPPPLMTDFRHSSSRHPFWPPFFGVDSPIMRLFVRFFFTPLAAEVDLRLPFDPPSVQRFFFTPSFFYHFSRCWFWYIFACVCVLLFRVICFSLFGRRTSVPATYFLLASLLFPLPLSSLAQALSRRRRFVFSCFFRP